MKIFVVTQAYETNVLILLNSISKTLSKVLEVREKKKSEKDFEFFTSVSSSLYDLPLVY